MKKIKAITIVETLITLLAISIMLIGPLTFVSKSFAYSKFLSDKTIAIGLSQEGLELATAHRNNATSTFVTSMDACFSSTGCSIDWNGVGGSETDIKINVCNDLSCALYLNSDNGRDIVYRHAFNAEPSRFYRQIKVTKNTNSYIVNSRVWIESGQGIPVDITLQKTIFIF